ncbi:uncharacterized protein AKAW2_30853S [Aspergillus luchuensis]|uniref:Uncharacterized protein n=1 Tax=Aspergillus kawachii TaxID=1069201 RepID=A0A7R7ZY84_ASPKA|nr:uncharacterized protein AKAW2_30853S [Aspergillus luchuensis]BCR97534.1 hypothetical protein AKAW2_30853S [Aspergillus luchuensis]
MNASLLRQISADVPPQPIQAMLRCINRILKSSTTRVPHMPKGFSSTYEAFLGGNRTTTREWQPIAMHTYAGWEDLGWKRGANIIQTVNTGEMRRKPTRKEFIVYFCVWSQVLQIQVGILSRPQHYSYPLRNTLLPRTPSKQFTICIM